MNRFDRRVRIVSFRLSEKEYRDLRGLCTAHGVRSVSDLARRAIQGGLGNDGAAEESLARAIRELRERVQEIDGELKQLARRLPRLSTSCQSSGEVK
jgi:50S ribosomal subunit-associated GTPase HflX